MYIYVLHSVYSFKMLPYLGLFIGLFWYTVLVKTLLVWHICMHLYIRIYVHMPIHTHTHINIHIHICIYSHPFLLCWFIFFLKLSLFYYGLLWVIFVLLWFTTGWRTSIGCLISWITFLKSATHYRALLRKMTYKNKASHESSPPCMGYLFVHLFFCFVLPY